MERLREARQRIWRRQVTWGLCWALFCVLWQPILYRAWHQYHETAGWWIAIPLWLLAGSPAVTFFTFYCGRISLRRLLEMLLLYGPVASIVIAWVFWACHLGGHWLIVRL